MKGFFDKIKLFKSFLLGAIGGLVGGTLTLLLLALAVSLGYLQSTINGVATGTVGAMVVFLAFLAWGIVEGLE